MSDTKKFETKEKEKPKYAYLEPIQTFKLRKDLRTMAIVNLQNSKVFDIIVLSNYKNQQYDFHNFEEM